MGVSILLDMTRPRAERATNAKKKMNSYINHCVYYYGATTLISFLRASSTDLAAPCLPCTLPNEELIDGNPSAPCPRYA